MKVPTSCFDIAQRFIGIREVPGAIDNHQITAMLRLDQSWPDHDEVPWCSAFTNYVAWLLRLPRSKSLRARSWLDIGTPVDLAHAAPENDIVILERGNTPEQGHVGFFAGFEDINGVEHGSLVRILGGNQGDGVSIAIFRTERVLGVRRLL